MWPYVIYLFIAFYQSKCRTWEYTLIKYIVHDIMEMLCCNVIFILKWLQMQLINQICNILRIVFAIFAIFLFALISDSFKLWIILSFVLQVPTKKKKTLKCQNSHLQNIKFTRLSKIGITTWLFKI